MDDIKRIKRTLYKTSKINIEFFMYEPRTEKYKSNYTNVINPILNLTYLNPSSMTEDFTTFNARTFKITPRNLYHVIKFFNTVVNWFYDKDKEDLFLINEDNELVFNSDYKSLYAVTKKSYGNNDILKAIPTVVDYNNHKYEGIYLYINENIYNIILTIDELETIFGLLKNFSFYDEIQLNLTTLEYNIKNNLVTTPNAIYTSYGNTSKVIFKTPFD